MDPKQQQQQMDELEKQLIGIMDLIMNPQTKSILQKYTMLRTFVKAQSVCMKHEQFIALMNEKMKQFVSTIQIDAHDLKKVRWMIQRIEFAVQVIISLVELTMEGANGYYYLKTIISSSTLIDEMLSLYLPQICVHVVQNIRNDLDALYLFGKLCTPVMIEEYIGQMKIMMQKEIASCENGPDYFDIVIPLIQNEQKRCMQFEKKVQKQILDELYAEFVIEKGMKWIDESFFFYPEEMIAYQQKVFACFETAMTRLENDLILSQWKEYYTLYLNTKIQKEFVFAAASEETKEIIAYENQLDFMIAFVEKEQLYIQNITHKNSYMINTFYVIMKNVFSKHDISEALASRADTLHKNAVTQGEVCLDPLQKVQFMMKFVSEKDRFVKMYSMLMCKRLLVSKTYSEESEKMMISLLKSDYGHSFTVKFEGMIQDIGHCMVQHEVVEARILQSNFWSLSTKENVQLPSMLMQHWKNFEKVYKMQNPSKKLIHVHQMGTVELEAVFSKRKYILIMSVIHASCLFIIADKRACGLQVLVEELKIAESHVKMALFSLVKTKLVLEQLDANQKKQYVINLHFAEKNIRVVVKNAVSKVTTKDMEQVQESVVQERSFVMDAAIVRIMKTRKELDHHLLVAEVIQSCAKMFDPDPAQIKIRIHHLMDREYLKRDENNRNVYVYLA